MRNLRRALITMAVVAAPALSMGGASDAQAADTLGAAAAITQACPLGANAITDLSFTVNGTAATVGAGKVIAGVTPGSSVTATFNVAPGCTALPVSFSSYLAPAPFANASNIGEQTLFSSSTGSFAAGQRTLTVGVPSCFFQIDMYVGSLVTRWDLPTVMTFLATPPTRQMLGVANGGTTACATSVNTPAVIVSTPVASPTPLVAGSQQAPQSTGPLPTTPTVLTNAAAPVPAAAPAVAGVSGLPSTSTSSDVAGRSAGLGFLLILIALVMLPGQASRVRAGQ